MSISMTGAFFDFVRAALDTFDEEQRLRLQLTVRRFCSNKSPINCIDESPLVAAVFSYIEASLRHLTDQNVRTLNALVTEKSPLPAQTSTPWVSACKDDACQCRYYYRRKEVDAGRLLSRISPCSLCVMNLDYEDYRVEHRRIKDMLGTANYESIYVDENSNWAAITCASHKDAVRVQLLLQRRGMLVNFQSRFI